MSSPQLHLENESVGCQYRDFSRANVTCADAPYVNRSRVVLRDGLVCPEFPDQAEQLTADFLAWVWPLAILNIFNRS